MANSFTPAFYQKLQLPEGEGGELCSSAADLIGMAVTRIHAAACQAGLPFALGFPEHDEAAVSIGRTLVVYGPDRESLKQLLSARRVSLHLCEHFMVAPVRAVPEAAAWVRYHRVRTTLDRTTPAALRAAVRRTPLQEERTGRAGRLSAAASELLAAGHSHEEASAIIRRSSGTRAGLPHFRHRSSSTGQTATIFVGAAPAAGRMAGAFDSFGLSSGGAVPVVG